VSTLGLSRGHVPRGDDPRRRRCHGKARVCSQPGWAAGCRQRREAAQCRWPSGPKGPWRLPPTLQTAAGRVASHSSGPLHPNRRSGCGQDPSARPPTRLDEPARDRRRPTLLDLASGTRSASGWPVHSRPGSGTSGSLSDSELRFERLMRSRTSITSSPSRPSRRRTSPEMSTSRGLRLRDLCASRAPCRCALGYTGSLKYRHGD
jgi:hypothetical protein